MRRLQRILVKRVCNAGKANTEGCGDEEKSKDINLPANMNLSRNLESVYKRGISAIFAIIPYMSDFSFSLAILPTIPYTVGNILFRNRFRDNSVVYVIIIVSS